MLKMSNANKCEELRNSVEKNMKLDKVNNKTASGIAYILDGLYNEFISNDGDLLGCGALKLSADVFRLIAECMQENTNAVDFIKTANKRQEI